MEGRWHEGLSTRVRLTVIYTSISIVSVALIFSLTFFTLYRTLHQEDVRDIQTRLLGYWAQFQTGGLDLLREEIGVDNLLVGERPFFVRIADRGNTTRFFSYPRIWESFSLDRLERLELAPNRVHTLHSPQYNYQLEVAGIWLSEQYFVQLGLSNETRTRLMLLFRRNFLVIALVVVVAGFAVGLVTASRALRPVARITEVAREIVETGRLDRRVEQERGGSEMARLVEVINAMLARIERLVDGMRNTVDMVAHDLRTPITRLRARCELALRNERNEDAQPALVETVEQSDEILRLVNTLLDITEAESGLMNLAVAPFALAPVLDEVVDLYELVAEERGVTLERRGDPSPYVLGEVVRIRQVVANIVDNGVKYCREGGRVVITTTVVQRDDTSIVRISISDDGPGLTSQERERVWERMYRGPVQPRQRGLGLGLSFVAAMVRAHGGRVWVESELGHGAQFFVELPAPT